MDMGPYISSIPRIFNMKNILKRKINIRKIKNLIISIIFNIKFKNGFITVNLVLGEIIAIN